jgi:hypothetical protein
VVSSCGVRGAKGRYMRRLLKGPEHNWGLSVGAFLPGLRSRMGNWSNELFDKARGEVAEYRVMEQEWLNQRIFNYPTLSHTHTHSRASRERQGEGGREGPRGRGVKGETREWMSKAGVMEEMEPAVAQGRRGDSGSSSSSSSSSSVQTRPLQDSRIGEMGGERETSGMGEERERIGRMEERGEWERFSKALVKRLQRVEGGQLLPPFGPPPPLPGGGGGAAMGGNTLLPPFASPPTTSLAPHTPHTTHPVSSSPPANASATLRRKRAPHARQEVPEDWEGGGGGGLLVVLYGGEGEGEGCIVVLVDVWGQYRGAVACRCKPRREGVCGALDVQRCRSASCSLGLCVRCS